MTARFTDDAGLHWQVDPDLHLEKLPESLTKSVRFAFIQKETAVVMGSPLWPANTNGPS